MMSRCARRRHRSHQHQTPNTGSAGTGSSRPASPPPVAVAACATFAKRRQQQQLGEQRRQKKGSSRKVAASGAADVTQEAEPAASWPRGRLCRSGARLGMATSFLPVGGDRHCCRRRRRSNGTALPAWPLSRSLKSLLRRTMDLGTHTHTCVLVCAQLDRRRWRAHTIAPPSTGASAGGRRWNARRVDT